MSSSNMEIPHFADISIDFGCKEALVQGSFDLIEKVRPDWQRSNFKSKSFTDGITNVLLGVYSGEDKNDMVMVRLYGNNTDTIIDRSAELRNMRLFFEHNCGPVIYATFANGLAYAFVPGDIINEESVRDPEVSQLIIEMMVKMHKMDLGSGDEREPCLWRKLKTFLDQCPDGFPNDPIKARRWDECQIMSKSRITQEVTEMEEWLKDSKSPVVFSHNDLLLANVIYDTRNEKDKKVTFIDYEYGDYNYQAFDIANHFAEFAGVCDFIDYAKYYPDETYQKDWLRRYLMAYHEKADISDEDLHGTYVLVNRFSLCANLMWGIWALCQAKNSAIDFDFIDYAMQRLNEYKRKKPQFQALK